MEEELIEGFLEAIFEDYSFLELLDLNQAIDKLTRIAGLEPSEALFLIMAVIELKMIKGERIPGWKRMLIEH